MSAFDQAYQPDQLNIETPEQVDLRLPIAGIGSRFLAILTDTAIQVFAALFLLLLFVLFFSTSQQQHFGTVSDNIGKWLIAAMVIFAFLLFWGYFALFEAFWNGQTPGKRLVKIRVIKDSVRQITFFEALARNLLRIVDMQLMYLVGLICMVCNKQQKRLGDLVAGTIVIHERTSEQPQLTHSSRGITAAMYPQPAPEFAQPAGAFQLPADAIARLHADDLHVIDSFLARALDFDLSTRWNIATRIATSMFAKMNLPLPTNINPERTLEAISYAMRAQSRV